MGIPTRLKKVRNPLSQKNFGSRLGTSQSAVQSWESGRSLPGADFLNKIHSEFDIDINWLLTGEGEMYVKDRGGRQDTIQPAPSGVCESISEYSAAPPSDIKDILADAQKILTSGHQEAIDVLKREIRYLYKSIETENRIKMVEDRLKFLEDLYKDGYLPTAKEAKGYAGVK